MKFSPVRFVLRLLAAAAGVWSLAAVAAAADVGTVFTYQGRLDSGGVAANGLHDMRFRLYDAATGGNQIGPMLTFNSLSSNPEAINVIDGQFTAPLDFGAVFTGTALWLEIDVRPHLVGFYNTLAPRQPLTAAPFALYALDSACCVWELNGVDAFYNAGDVGIGTDTPQAPLHVVGAIHSRGSATNGVHVYNPNDEGVSVHLSWLNDVARLRYGGSGAGALNGFAIQGQGDSTKLRLLNNGNLGLGDDDPQARLHLRTDDLTLSSGALLNDRLIIEAADAVAGLYSSGSGTWGSAITLKEVSGGNVVDTWSIARLTSTAIQPSALRITYGTNADYGQNTSVMAINTNGNVGIGTGAPGEKLTVAGVIHSTTGGVRFPDGTVQATAAGGGGSSVWAVNGADIYYNAGNVGIGTSSPQSPLHVQGNADIDGTLTIGSPTTTLAIDNTGVGGGSELFMFNSAQVQTVKIDSDEADAGEILLANNSGANVIELDALEGGTAVLRLSAAGAADAIVLKADDGSGASRIITDVLQINGADLSEQFDVTGDYSVEPGMVVSIDPANPGKLTVATAAYDRKVAGIVSGAGGVRTGLVMGQEGTIAHGEHAVALTGRVWCFVDASFGPIEPGDLLTTSPTPGHAMKAADPERSRGAVIGKAMTGLASGAGMVLVLVQPQ